MVKHITVSDKSLLTGDEAADLLVEYAALLGQRGSADSVQLAVIGPDGNEGVASFLLNSGTSIVTETTNSTAPAPDNGTVEHYMHDRIAALHGNDQATPDEIAGTDTWNSSDPE